MKFKPERIDNNTRPIFRKFPILYRIVAPVLAIILFILAPIVSIIDKESVVGSWKACLEFFVGAFLPRIDDRSRKTRKG